MGMNLDLQMDMGKGRIAFPLIEQLRQSLEVRVHRCHSSFCPWLSFLLDWGLSSW